MMPSLPRMDTRKPFVTLFHSLRRNAVYAWNKKILFEIRDMLISYSIVNLLPAPEQR